MSINIIKYCGIYKQKLRLPSHRALLPVEQMRLPRHAGDAGGIHGGWPTNSRW